MAGEPGDAAEHLERFHVEVGALPAPCCDQSIDLVLHVDQCRGSVDVKSLDVKIYSSLTVWAWSGRRLRSVRRTPFLQGGLEHAFRTHLGPTAVPAARRAPHPPVPRSARPHTRAPHPARRPVSPTSAAAPAMSPHSSPTAGPTAHITGFDLSPEMLASADKEYAGPTAGGGRLDFRPADAAHWTPDEPYDLIVSNAALQWVPSHPESLPRLDRRPRPGRHLRLPGPRQLHLAQPRPPRRTLRHPAAGAPASATTAAATSTSWSPPTTSPASPTSAARPTPGRRRTSSSSPATTRCWTGSRAPPCGRSSPNSRDEPDAADEFLAQYRDLLRKAYPPGPHGTVFPFRRIFAVARKVS